MANGFNINQNITKLETCINQKSFTNQALEKKPQESKTKLNIHLNSFIYIQCQINQESKIRLHVRKYLRHSESCSVTTSKNWKVTLRFVKANITKTCFKNNGILRNFCKRDKKSNNVCHTLSLSLYPQDLQKYHHLFSPTSTSIFRANYIAENGIWID